MSSSQKQKDESSDSDSDSSTSDSNERQRGIANFLITMEETVGTNLISVILALAAIWALTALGGSPIDPEGLVTLLAIGLVLGLLSRRVGDFSFSFWMVTSAIVVPAWAYLVPGSLAAAFDPLVSYVGRIPFVDLGAFTPVEYAVLAGFLVLVVWGLNIRVFSAYRRTSGRPEAANADTVARAITRRMRKLGKMYISIGVAIGTFVAAFAYDILVGGAQLGGNAFEFVAEAPVVAAAIASDIISWLALGGGAGGLESVPILGAVVGFVAGLGPVGFGVLAGSLLVLAVISRGNQ